MNKSIKVLSVIVAIGSLLLLSGCAKYKALPLQPIAKQTNVATKNKEVTLNHKVFDKNDCQTYLGRRNILKKGYQPVQLTLTNTTDRSYTYSTSSLSLPTVPARLVAKKVNFSTASRVTGFTAAGIAFLTPIVPLVLVGIDLVVPGAGIAALCCLGASTGFFAAGIRDGVKAGKENKKLSLDFEAKVFPQEGTLKPGQTISGIVFVAKKYFSNDFTFTLNDAQTHKTIVLSPNSEVTDIK